MQHPNFYESLDEAIIRLLRTVVLYDGEPFYVLALANHMTDNIIRIYLDPIGVKEKRRSLPELDNYQPNSASVGPLLDAYMETEAGKKAGLLRKQLNSPLFQKFRPFPLGMCNTKTGAVYLERQPQRQTQQGLMRNMVLEHRISLDNSSSKGYGPNVSLFGEEFKACVMGDYPSPQTVFKALLDPSVANNSLGFHRHFALVRGPIDMLFLAYKQDVVGVLPVGDFSMLRLGRKFQHVREAVFELGLFSSIVM
jgi:hypothetical protein